MQLVLWGESSIPENLSEIVRERFYERQASEHFDTNVEHKKKAESVVILSACLCQCIYRHLVY